MREKPFLRFRDILLDHRLDDRDMLVYVLFEPEGKMPDYGRKVIESIVKIEDEFVAAIAYQDISVEKIVHVDALLHELLGWRVFYLQLALKPEHGIANRDKAFFVFRFDRHAQAVAFEQLSRLEDIFYVFLR
jgi:hypothetical protein